MTTHTIYEKLKKLEIPTHLCRSEINTFCLICSVSHPDPDPCVSVLKWLPWTRIRIGNTDRDPNPGQSKWCLKRKKSEISS